MFNVHGTYVALPRSAYLVD